MEFKRVTDLRSSDGYAVPAYLIVPERPVGGAAVAHGYGGSKEQMLGLAARLAEAGWAACCFDIRGHGEHPAPLDPEMAHDMEAALGAVRPFGRVAAIGHSLGGRLALMSAADLVVAISPAVAQRPSEEGRAMLVHFGSTAVRAASPTQILEILRAWPPPAPPGVPTLILHARGDIPTLIEGIRALAAALPEARLVEVAEHQHQPADLPASLLGYLHRWYNHLDLKTNAGLYAAVPRWLAERAGSRGGR